MENVPVLPDILSLETVVLSVTLIASLAATPQKKAV
jgi:hypothetical protein